MRDRRPSPPTSPIRSIRLRPVLLPPSGGVSFEVASWRCQRRSCAPSGGGPAPSMSARSGCERLGCGDGSWRFRCARPASPRSARVDNDPLLHVGCTSTVGGGPLDPEVLVALSLEFEERA